MRVLRQLKGQRHVLVHHVVVVLLYGPSSEGRLRLKAEVEEGRISEGHGNKHLQDSNS